MGSSPLSKNRSSSGARLPTEMQTQGPLQPFPGLDLLVNSNEPLSLRTPGPQIAPAEACQPLQGGSLSAQLGSKGVEAAQDEQPMSWAGSRLDLHNPTTRSGDHKHRGRGSAQRTGSMAAPMPQDDWQVAHNPGGERSCGRAFMNTACER